MGLAMCIVVTSLNLIRFLPNSDNRHILYQNYFKRILNLAHSIESALIYRININKARIIFSAVNTKRELLGA